VEPASFAVCCIVLQYTAQQQQINLGITMFHVTDSIDVNIALCTTLTSDVAWKMDTHMRCFSLWFVVFLLLLFLLLTQAL